MALYEYMNQDPDIEVYALYLSDSSIVIANPGGIYVGMKMELPSSVARMAWKTERPL